jgi:putative Holliday junction resolvase
VTSTGRVLGVDHGEASLGLAISDGIGLTAQPLDAFRRVGPRKDLERLAALVREREVSRIVVGLPLRMSGEEGERARAVRDFVAALAARVPGVPIELWDERLTSAEAERILIAADVRRRVRKQVVDRLAAVLILQSWLDARGAAGHGGP